MTSSPAYGEVLIIKSDSRSSLNNVPHTYECLDEFQSPVDKSEYDVPHFPSPQKHENVIESHIYD